MGEEVMSRPKQESKNTSLPQKFVHKDEFMPLRIKPHDGGWQMIVLTRLGQWVGAPMGCLSK